MKSGHFLSLGYNGYVYALALAHTHTHTHTHTHSHTNHPIFRLFDHSFHENTVLPLLRAEVGPDFREVDGSTGITVKCGDTNCIFEFVTYKYIGEAQEEESDQPQTVTLAELLQNSNDEPHTDNDQHPMHVNRSQSMPVHSQYQDRESNSDSDRDPSSSLSPLSASFSPPLHPAVDPLEPGGVYNFGGGQNPPQLQQQNKTFDFSPQARSLKRQQTLKADARALKRQETLEPASQFSSSSTSVPNNDQQAHSSEFSDSNRCQYTTTEAKTIGSGQNRMREASVDTNTINKNGSRSSVMGRLQSHQVDWGATATSDAISARQLRQGTSYTYKGPALSTTRQMQSGKGSSQRRVVQRPRMVSDTSTLLSSIDEDGSSEGTESQTPVFDPPKDS